MKFLALILSFISLSSFAAVVGMSTYPFQDSEKALTAEMNGYFNRGKEVGAGIRYTGAVTENDRFDIYAGGAQETRAFNLGSGWDFGMLTEDVNRPRVSTKAFMEMQKIDETYFNYVGVAPTMRKGFSVANTEIFPYIALPTGIVMNNDDNKFEYFASLTLGYAQNFPGLDNDQFVLSAELNMDMGQTSDSATVFATWKWN